MTFSTWMEHAAEGFEAAGALTLVVGLVWALAVAVRVRREGGGRSGYRALRETFGGVLLLGLEILVAADLIRTVAVTPTLNSVAVLGLIVVIRTLLSFSLQVEIEGVAPWRRAATTGVGAISRAAQNNRTGDPDARAHP